MAQRGFPESLLATTNEASARWREDLVRSYLERDVPMFAPRLPAETLRRLWTMLAHLSGGLFTATRLAEGLGVSSPTVDRYTDLLADLGLVRRLPAWHSNTGKRLTRSPKVVVRDTGLLHALLETGTRDELLSHPAVGPSYESFVVESVINACAAASRPFHYRAARGDEVDLVLSRAGRPSIAIEVKRSTAPTVSPGFHRALTDLGVQQAYVVHPDSGDEPYRIAEGVVVIGLTQLVVGLRSGSLPF